MGSCFDAKPLPLLVVPLSVTFSFSREDKIEFELLRSDCVCQFCLSSAIGESSANEIFVSTLSLLDFSMTA